MEKQLTMERDPARKFQRCMVQHHKVDTGGQEELESLGRRSVEIGRDVDIGIRPGTAGRATAMQVGKGGAVMLQRLDCLRDSLVDTIHRLIVAPHHLWGMGRQLSARLARRGRQYLLGRQGRS